jgi:hypothetical protein
MKYSSLFIIVLVVAGVLYIPSAQGKPVQKAEYNLGFEHGSKDGGCHDLMGECGYSPERRLPDKYEEDQRNAYMHGYQDGWSTPYQSWKNCEKMCEDE